MRGSIVALVFVIGLLVLPIVAIVRTGRIRTLGTPRLPGGSKSATSIASK
jgi:hypothetical protein